MEYQNSSFEIANPVSQSAVNTYMTRVFGWMTLALTITALTALIVASTPLFAMIAPLYYVLIIAELILVGVLIGLVNKMSAVMATLVFIGYSVLNGLTLAMLFAIFSLGDIVTCFLITAGTFGFMSAYGYFTNRDLTSLGNFLVMALIGLVIASIVNIFWADSMLYWIISYAGVFIFIGLTAYDTQKIKNQALVMSHDGELVQKSAIMGALTLYLDFINLFIFILRIFGGRK